MTNPPRVTLEPLLEEIARLKATVLELERRLAAAECELGNRRYADAARLKLVRMMKCKRI